MRVLLVLLIFSSFNSIAQSTKVNYNWPVAVTTPGFYESYPDFVANKPVHTGPFKVSEGRVKCARDEKCTFCQVILTSEVKAVVFPLNIKYFYDGVHLYMVFKSFPGAFGKHIEIDRIMNNGRFGYFERLVSPDRGIIKKEASIIDLKMSTVYKESRKDLNILFKFDMDLFEEYREDHEQKKLIKYLILLNQR